MQSKRQDTPPRDGPDALQQSAELGSATGTQITDVWRRALDLYLNRLSRKAKDAILNASRETNLNQDNVEKILQPLQSQYNSLVFSRLLEKINPVVDHIHSFSTVFQVSLQAHPNPACLIWGGLSLILDISVFKYQLKAPRRPESPSDERMIMWSTAH